MLPFIMPDDPLAQPLKPATPVAQPATPPTATPAATTPVTSNAKTTTRESSAEATEDAAPAKYSPWIISLAVISVILLITVVLFGAKVSDRDRILVETKNRTAQIQTAATQLQTQVDDAKAEAASLQKKLDAADAETAQFKTDLAKAKVDTDEVQARLDKARAAATVFQTLAAEAKVASLKHQGKVEVAQAQTAVMLEQLNKARGDTIDLKNQLSELQTKLDHAQMEIARLQMPPAKK